jgi:hypothetical protein
MTTLAKHYEQIVSSYKLVGGFVLPLAKPSVVVQRFLTFEGTLDDWHTVCRRFDAHFDEWSSYQNRLQDFFMPGLNQSVSIEQQEFLAKWGTLTSEIRLDIRSFYIFSKIPLISFAAVLFAMANNRSAAWHSVTRFLNLIAKDNAPQVFNEFHVKFERDLQWFRGHINLYRNEFVEHPFSVALPGAIVSDDKGARLTGLTGRGISKEDESLISEIEAVGGDSFSGVSTLRLIERYFLICRKLEEIPVTHRQRAEDMIRRVGLESGELEPLAARLAGIFAGFISFFAAWKNQI